LKWLPYYLITEQRAQLAKKRERSKKKFGTVESYWVAQFERRTNDSSKIRVKPR